MGTNCLDNIFKHDFLHVGPSNFVLSNMEDFQSVLIAHVRCLLEIIKIYD